MFKKAMVVWILGLLIFIPYGTYYLLYQAPREQYALVITLMLFWAFGFWGVVGPLLAAIKVRAVLRVIETARSKDSLMAALQSADTRDAVIELIASENRIPRFLASRVYKLLADRFAANMTARSQERSVAGSRPPS